MPTLIAMFNRLTALGRRLDMPVVLLVLILLGSYAAAHKMELVRHIDHVGGADSAGYALMARSVAQGRGVVVDYISWFFIPYPPDISHREDHWPPLLAWLIAPFYLAFGVEAWVARIAPILLGSIGLPLAAAWLGWSLSRRAYVGLAAGLLMLVNPVLYSQSLIVLSDIALATMFTAFLAALIGARYRPWLHLPAGLFAALAYYAKNSEILLLGVYLPAALLACGFSRTAFRWALAGLMVAFLAILPWLISSYRLYGNPLHSTQNYVSGYFGIVGWNQGTYPVYWGHNLPKTSDRWTKFGDRYEKVTRRNLAVFTRYILLGPDAPESEWQNLGRLGQTLRQWIEPNPPPRRAAAPTFKPLDQWRQPAATLCGLIGLAFALLTLALAPVKWLACWLWTKWRRKRSPPSSSPGSAAPPRWTPPPRSLAGPVAAMLLLLLIHWALIVFLWSPLGRFSYMFMPALAVLACTAGSWLIELPLALAVPRFLNRWHWVVSLLLVGALLVYFVPRAPQWRSHYTRITHLPGDDPYYPQVGDWLSKNLPRAVVMSYDPWAVQFHCVPTIKVVNIPYDIPDRILAVARYYGVTHYLAQRQRPGINMEFYTDRPNPAFKLVPGAPGKLFELNYAALPNLPDLSATPNPSTQPAR